MKLPMIRRVVMAALLLPTIAMTLEAGFLISYSYRDLSTLEATRHHANLLTLAGEIASSATPDEAEATINYLRQPGPVSLSALGRAQARLDQQIEKLNILIGGSVSDVNLQENATILKARAADLHQFRRDLAQGRVTELGPKDVYQPLSQAYLDLVTALDVEINDNRLLRKLDQLQVMLQGHEAGLTIAALGHRYLSGTELTHEEREALSGAIHLHDIRLAELADFAVAEEPAAVRFHKTDSGARYREVLAHIRSGGISPARLSVPPLEMADLWAQLYAERTDAWKRDLARHIRDTRELADSLTQQSRMHFLGLVTGVIVLLVLTTTVLILATKGISLVDRLTRDREALIHELRSASHTDLLTGLPNRRGFDAAISTIRNLESGPPTQTSLVIFDLDRFKLVNDMHGHDGGDAVLAQVARIARGSFRAMDLLARHGGEEFVALLPSTGLEEAARAADHVRLAIEAADIHLPDGKVIRVTASFGCACHTGPLESSHLNGMIKKADLALYAAKFSGRNRVVRDGAFNEISMERREVRFA